MNEVIIVFNDGSELETSVNGNCFITDTKPVFPSDLSEVIIRCDSNETETLYNVEVIECASLDDKYWFAFREMSEEELKEIANDAQIFYTAVMTDTLMEE